MIAGDGIGQEVMPEGLRVMDAAARKFGIDLKFDHFDFSSWDYYETVSYTHLTLPTICSV